MSHGDLGRVVNIFDASSAHALAVFLSTKAASFSSVGRIILIACWYDLEDVTRALISCKESGHSPIVYVDHRNTLGNTARDQLVRLLELRSNGIPVRVVKGHLMKEAYEADGRSSIGGRGLLHAKALIIDDFLMLGSTNWTTSSKANHEMSVLLELNREGHAQVDKWLETVDGSAEGLSDEVIRKAEASMERRSASRSRKK